MINRSRVYFLENNMKTYKQFMAEESKVELEESKNAMRDWIIHQVENTEHDHDAIKAAFIKKFGKDKVRQFDKIVSEIVD